MPIFTHFSTSHIHVVLWYNLESVWYMYMYYMCKGVIKIQFSKVVCVCVYYIHTQGDTDVNMKLYNVSKWTLKL